MKKVLENIMLTVFAMLTVVINLLVVQFIYEVINYHLSTETIIAMFLIGSVTIMLDSAITLAALEYREVK